MSILRRLSAFASTTFPLWALLAAVLGFRRPATFAFILPHLELALGMIMFGMGATLSWDDLRRVFERPREILIGVLAQYGIMPLLACSLAWGFGLGPELAIGFLLLGACPGGTASNVIAYLARADVALSVTLTSVSTLLAPLVTPALVWALARHWMPIEAGALFLSIVQIVLLPVVLGMVAKRWFGAIVDRLTSVLPLFSVVVIVLVVGAVVGKSALPLQTVGGLIALGVILHNGLGLALGYGAGRLTRLGLDQRRTLAIEVGMQNSGLAAALAVTHFAPEAAVPAALFSIWHNLSGPVLAAWWARWHRGRPESRGLPSQ